MFTNWDNKNNIRETESEAIIRFQDCDPFRHLNNSKYFDYFYNSREDQVAKLYHIRPVDIFKQFGTGWVSYNSNISYLKPAMVSEWVKMHSRLIFFDEDGLVVEYYMTDQHSSHLKTVFLSNLRYIDGATGKRTTHQPEILDFLEATCWQQTEKSELGMTERIKLIKSSF